MRTIKNLVGAVLVAIAIFVFWVVILPNYDGRAYLQAAILSRSADLETKNNLLNKITELDKEYQSRYAELKRLALVVPADKHVEEMITILQDVFSATGILLKDMALSAGEGQSDSPYSLVNMEFTFNAPYDSVLNFLIAIENSLRLIDTTNLSIGINKDQSIGNGPQTLAVLFKASAYFINKNLQAKTSVPSPAASANTE